MSAAADLITAIQNSHEQAEASAVTERLVRMPVIWHALQDSELRKAAFASGRFSLSKLIEAINNDEHPELSVLIERAVGMTDFEPSKAGEIEDYSGPQLETLLTVAAGLSGNDKFLRQALQSGEFEIRRAAINALINHRALDEIEREARLELESETINQLAVDALLGADRAIAPKLAQHVEIETQSPAASHFDASLNHWLHGQLDSAQSQMEAAWEDITDQAASTADAIAHLAADNAQPLIEIQALERAINFRSSAERRAKLAVAKLKVNDAQGALESLEKDSQSPQELIALATTYQAVGQPSQAREVLNKVELDQMTPASGWERRLLEGMVELGDMQQALDLADSIIERHPSDQKLRRLAAQISMDSGDSQAAVEHALLLSSLTPDDQSASLLLAEAYYADKQPEKALPIWSSAAEDSVEIKAKAIKAALDSGEISAALQFSQELVETDPNSAQARLALGKSLILAGNQPGGKLHIRRATEIEPGNPTAWLELVRLQAESGEDIEQLLADAISACPANAELLSAQADWLKDQGRLTEALEVSQQAYKLAEDRPELALQQAKLLAALDKPEQARPLFEEVIRRQPANWPARIELAAIQEGANEIDLALATLDGLPDDVDGAAFVLLARLNIKGGTDSEADRGQRALSALAKAKLEQAAANPDFNYWQARALQLCQRHEEALQRFQGCMKSLPPERAELKQRCVQGQAESALASNQIPVAISILERAHGEDELAPSGLALLSKAYLTAGLAEEALAPAVEACDLDPQNEQVRAQYLAACKSTGSIQQALSKIDDWLAEDQNNQRLLYQKAAFQVDLKEVEPARRTIAQLAWQARHQPKTLDEISQLLMRADQPASAVRLLQNADYQEPDNPARLAQLAQAAMEAKQPRIAADAWEKILDEQTNDIEALLGAADACWQLDQRMSAIGYWQRALAVEPERADLHSQLARAQLTNGETSQALDHFRSAVALSPDDNAIRLEAVNALMANHNYPDALNLLKGAPQVETSLDARWLSLMAQLYLGLGRAQEALATGLRASPDQPNAKLLALTALAHGRSGQKEVANESLERGLGTEPADLDEARWLARAALELGHWRAAHGLALNAESSEPDSAEQKAFELEVACRLADAHTLVSTFGSAVDHAPSAELIDQSIYRQLKNSLVGLEQAGRPASEVRAWRARLNSAFGHEGSADSPALRSLPADHVIQQHAVEGLALAQLEAGNAEEALRSLASAPEYLQAGPWSPMIAGLAHLQMERPSLARKAFGAIDKGSWLWPLAAFLVGKCWRMEGRPDEAINSWNTAVLAWPSEFRWQSELALTYRQQDKPEAALPHLQAALEASPDDHDLRLPLARSLFELGELTEAVAQYQLVEAQFKKDPEVLTEIGHAFMASGQFKEAYERFADALSIKPDHVPAEVGAAEASWHQGDSRQAEKHSAKAIRRNVREPKLVLSLSEMMIAAGQPQQALSLLEDAFGQSQLPSDIARSKASALFELGRAPEAIKLLRQIVKQDPEDDRSWAMLAKAHAGADQAGQAIDALRIALNLRPGHKSYRMKLARLFRETGQLDQALDELTAMQNQDPEDPNVPMEIGLVHRARRQLRQALSAFQRSIALNQESAAAYFQAGMVLKALKAYPQAVEMLEKAVSINPKDSEAMHQLAAVQALQLVHGGIQQTAVSG